jgi:hypothetical protein
LIPKNTSLVIVRIPGSSTNISKPKKFIKNFENIISENVKENKKFNSKILRTDLTSMPISEEDKIFAMMMQSTVDYNNNIFQSSEINSQNYSQLPPSSYICHRCHTPGHWIQKCSLKPNKTFRFDPKSRMTGIPMSMRFQKPQNENCEKLFSENVKNLNKEILANYFCDICKEIFRNPTLTPCCRTTFCYDCVERKILFSDEHECPKCEKKYLMLSQFEANEKIRAEILKIK